MIRWALKLAVFNIEWEHRPSTQNTVADVLSRVTIESIMGENVNCAIIRDFVLSSRDQLIEEQRTEPELGHIYRYLENPEDSSVNAAISGRLITIVSNYPNEIVTLDLIGPYPVSRVRRNRYVLVITDHFSKWARIVHLKKSSARVIADSFIDNYISRFEAPIKLISDNDPQFISDIFENLSERLGIRHVKTVVYRPQANRTEHVNRNLVQIIAK
ncbi:retrovirus-related Pol polyprotein from transposon 17.6 [Trichonephila clavipes]|uniref:Retrovirus-related Pol polyprotein from transposon 17.6 n=1 Tax=Trichonephila clavipes TaxID=2585209 RepID=A0A8X6WEL0_TRICX|nr:retrovirus-related Pol polyprotein from transposon 17.6 [Trichonephila clavipes]